MSKPFKFDLNMPALTIEALGIDFDGRDRGRAS